MTADDQTFIPRSFIDLFVLPGRAKTREPREHIARRYDLCEDLAQTLTEHAKAVLLDLGITEADVIAQVHRGLLSSGSQLVPDEAQWVVCRLAELLGWPMPTAVQKTGLETG